MTRVYSHELGRYIQLRRRTTPVKEGEDTLATTPIRVEVLLRSGRVASAPAVAFFTNNGELVIQAAEEIT